MKKLHGRAQVRLSDHKPGRRCFRLPPCPSYDISGMERWLSALSEQGLFLTEDGFFLGLGVFEYREPQQVKYRLEAVQKNPSVWSDDGGEPDPEQVELSAAYAWDYVAKRQDFYIYRSADPTARELNTDPAVQALALNAVKKRKAQALLSTLLLFFLYPLLLTRGCLLLTAISIGSWWMCLALLLALLIVWDDLRAYRSLRRVQKALLTEGVIPAESKGAAPYFLRKAGKLLLALFLACTLLRTWGISLMDGDKLPLSDYGGDLPFATLRDLAGEGCTDYQQTMTGMSMGFNTISEYSDWLSPRCIEMNEYASLTRADGSPLNGGLNVDYYRLRSESLSKLLMKELYRLDRWKQKSTPLTIPDLQTVPEVDEVQVYTLSSHFPTALIRKGNTVLRVTFLQFTDSFTLTEWVETMCSRIQ